MRFPHYSFSLLKYLLNKIKNIWYKFSRQNGQNLNSGMTVVIQEMAKCEAAGVLFTCDPVTNNPSVTVITGNYGLGEVSFYFERI